MERRLTWLLIAVCNFAIMFLIFTKFENLDYKAFYAAGTIARTAPQQLYSAAQFSRCQFADGCLPYNHLPHETAIWAPLSLLTYSKSLALWRLISLVLVGATGCLLARIAQRPAVLTVIQCLAFFPVIDGICHGQDSALLVFLLAASLLLLLNDHPVSAGLVLSIALFKPQVPLIIAIALLASRRYKAVAAFAAGTAALTAGTYALFGNWIPQLIAFTRETEQVEIATEMISLRGVIGLFAPDLILPLSIIVGLAFVVLRLPDWRRSRDVAVLFGSAVLVGSLIAFHFHIQDASLFLIPIAVLLRCQAFDRLARLAATPLFCAPAVLLLMIPPVTCALVISSLVWLRRLCVMMINTGVEEEGVGDTGLAAPRLENVIGLR